MLLSPTVKVGGDHYSRTVAPLFPHCYNYHPFYIFALSPTLTPVGDPLHYKRRPMRRGRGGQPVDIYPRPSSKLTVASCAPEQELESIQTSSSRVLRIRAARSWVKSLRVCVRVSPRSALCATSAPRRTEKGLRPHRCSRKPIPPDIFGAPGRGRRGCANLIRRLHELDHCLLHRHAIEEKSFGGGRSVCVEPIAPGAGGRWGRRRRRNGCRRASSWPRGVRTRSAPLPGGADPVAYWYPWCHTLAGPRSGRWVPRRSGPANEPARWNERGAATWAGHCSF